MSSTWSCLNGAPPLQWIGPTLQPGLMTICQASYEVIDAVDGAKRGMGELPPTPDTRYLSGLCIGREYMFISARDRIAGSSSRIG